MRILLDLIVQKGAAKRKIGLVNESSVYKNLRQEFAKDKIHVYSKKNSEVFNAILEVEKEELHHAKRLLESDLGVGGVLSVFNTVLISLMAVFFRIYSSVIAESMTKIIGVEISATTVEDLFNFGFLGLLAYGTYGIIKNYKRDKYFLLLIQDKIKEKEAEQERKLKELEDELLELKNSVMREYERKGILSGQKRLKKKGIFTCVGLFNR